MIQYGLLWPGGGPLSPRRSHRRPQRHRGRHRGAERQTTNLAGSELCHYLKHDEKCRIFRLYSFRSELSLRFMSCLPLAGEPRRVGARAGTPVTHSARRARVDGRRHPPRCSWTSPSRPPRLSARLCCDDVLLPSPAGALTPRSRPDFPRHSALAGWRGRESECLPHPGARARQPPWACAAGVPASAMATRQARGDLFGRCRLCAAAGVVLSPVLRPLRL